MSIFSYTSTHGMMKKTPLIDHTDDHCHNEDDFNDLDDQSDMEENS